jgi:hypothetical protein
MVIIRTFLRRAKSLASRAEWSMIAAVGYGKSLGSSKFQAASSKLLELAESAQSLRPGDQSGSFLLH